MCPVTGGYSGGGGGFGGGGYGGGYGQGWGGSGGGYGDYSKFPLPSVPLVKNLFRKYH